MGNYTDLSKLTTMKPLNINFSGFEDSATAINTLQTVTKENVGNLWFEVSIVVIFMYLVWVLYDSENNFLLDITRSMLVASVWCLFISSAFLLSNWITTVMPIIWFATIAFISFAGVLKLKNKGL